MCTSLVVPTVATHPAVCYPAEWVSMTNSCCAVCCSYVRRMFDILPKDNLPLRAAVIAQTRKWVFRHPKVDEVKHLLGDDPTADEQALDQAIVSSIRDLFACLRNSTQYNTLQGRHGLHYLLLQHQREITGFTGKC